MEIFCREKVGFMAPILVLYGDIAGDRTRPQLEMVGCRLKQRFQESIICVYYLFSWAVIFSVFYDVLCFASIIQQ